MRASATCARTPPRPLRCWPPRRSSASSRWARPRSCPPSPESAPFSAVHRYGLKGTLTNKLAVVSRHTTPNDSRHVQDEAILEVDWRGA